MWNGNLGGIGIFFVPLFVALGGCDSSAAPVQETLRVSQRGEHRADRQQVDLVRNRVWVLTEHGVVVYRNARRERTEIPLPQWFWAGAPYSCPPDLALGPKGEAIVTSDIVPTLWRIDPETLEVSVHPLTLDADTEKDVGFSEFVYSLRHGKYFAVSSIDGSVWSVDSLLTKGQKVTTSAPVERSCGSIL